MTVGAEDPRVSLLLGDCAASGSLRLRRAQTCTLPKFIVHGESDELISIKEIRKFYAQIPEPKELVTIEDANHLFDGKTSMVGEAVEDLLADFNTVRNLKIMQDAVIVSAVRTAVGKAPKGTLSVMRPDELAATAIKGALDRVPQLEPASIDDVILGCAMPEGRTGLERGPHRQLARGYPGRSVGRHRESVLLFRPAGDRVWRRTHHARPGPRRGRRRHRVDEHGANGRQ